MPRSAKTTSRQRFETTKSNRDQCREALARLDDALDSACLSMIEAGWTQREVASLWGVSPSWVGQVVARHRMVKQ